MHEKPERKCEICKAKITAKRRDAKVCGSGCRAVKSMMKKVSRIKKLTVAGKK